MNKETKLQVQFGVCPKRTVREKGRKGKEAMMRVEGRSDQWDGPQGGVDGVD